MVPSLLGRGEGARHVDAVGAGSRRGKLREQGAEVRPLNPLLLTFLPQTTCSPATTFLAVGGRGGMNLR